MSKDTAVIKALTQLGLRPEPDLTPEEEDMLSTALDPHKQYLEDIERLFTKSDTG